MNCRQVLNLNFESSLTYKEKKNESVNINCIVPLPDESSWDGGTGTEFGDETQLGPGAEEEDNWDSSNENENEEEPPDTSFVGRNGKGQGDTTKAFGRDYYVKNYSSSTIPYASPTEKISNKNGFDSLEGKRQEAINELMTTEESYMKDMNIVEAVNSFYFGTEIS